MSLKGKKILVTGGLGFIGSNLATKLEETGARVDIFDLEKGDDIEDYKKLEKVIKRKFDFIYHLAGFSGPTQNNKDVRKSFNINTLATVDLCNLIVRYSPKTKLILSSSRLEYGKPQYLPVDENHPVNPTSAYGLSKLNATQIALVYSRKKNLDVTIFRTSNVYGPHKKQSSGYNIVNNFIKMAKNGETIKVFGDGSQERDYIFIEDLISAFILAAEKGEISKGQIYNLGFGKGIKFKKMVDLIINVVGKGRAQIIPWPKAYKDVETGSYISDISKIKKQLGFSPQTDFEEGITKTI